MNAWYSSTVRRNAWNDLSRIVLTRTMHSVSVATTARTAQFLSTEQSCRTPSKHAARSGSTRRNVQRLDRSDRLLGLDPPDVLDRALERVDLEQADLLPEEALRRARLLKAVQQHPVRHVRLLEDRVRPGLRPRRVRRPDAQRVHERVDARRDDVAVVPERHGDAEVPLQDPVGAEDAAVLSENDSSDGKPKR